MISKPLKLSSFVILFIFYSCSNQTTDKQSTPTTDEAAFSSQIEAQEKQNKQEENEVIEFENIQETLGDLDKDGTPEKVIVYQTNRESDMGLERRIHLFKKDKEDWTLWKEISGPILPSEHGGVMGDPFHNIEIKNGTIVIEQLGGSRSKWSYTHRYRYQEETFKLIGANIVVGAVCEYWEDYDYNLSTGQINFKKETSICEGDKEIKTTVTDKKLDHKLASLPEMNGFHPGENQLLLKKESVGFNY